jgi:hypothetical protein
VQAVTKRVDVNPELGLGFPRLVFYVPNLVLGVTKKGKAISKKVIANSK